MIGRSGLIILVAGTLTTSALAGAGYAYHEQTRTVVNQVLGFTQTATTESVLTATPVPAQSGGPRLAQAAPTISQPEPIPASPPSPPAGIAPDPSGPAPAPAPQAVAPQTADTASPSKSETTAPVVVGGATTTSSKMPAAHTQAHHQSHRRAHRYVPESCW